MTDKLNYIDEAFKNCFVDALPSFNNVLWQLMINEVHKEKSKAFHLVTSGKHSYQLVLVFENEKGYNPLEIYFNDDYKKYDDTSKIIEELNKQVFNLDYKIAAKIILSSL